RLAVDLRRVVAALPARAVGVGEDVVALVDVGAGERVGVVAGGDRQEGGEGEEGRGGDDGSVHAHGSPGVSGRGEAAEEGVDGGEAVAVAALAAAVGDR